MIRAPRFAGAAEVEVVAVVAAADCRFPGWVYHWLPECSDCFQPGAAFDQALPSADTVESPGTQGGSPRLSSLRCGSASGSQGTLLTNNSQILNLQLR